MAATKQHAIARLLDRPRPPVDLVAIEAATGPDRFVPAPDIVQWIRQAFLDEQDDGPLYNPDHAHLRSARIGALWTNCANTRQMRQIVGQAEIPSRSLGKSGAWQKARGEQQLREWFEVVPDFLLTFDGIYADRCDDAAFCALVDHELYHCAQALDDFGAPRFNQQTGEAIWTMRGHDVEEFVGVVRRFGIQAAGEAATDMVIAAARPPEIAQARIAQACGTCARRAA